MVWTKLVFCCVSVCSVTVGLVSEAQNWEMTGPSGCPLPCGQCPVPPFTQSSQCAASPRCLKWIKSAVRVWAHSSWRYLETFQQRIRSHHISKLWTEHKRLRTHQTFYLCLKLKCPHVSQNYNNYSCSGHFGVLITTIRGSNKDDLVEMV